MVGDGEIRVAGATGHGHRHWGAAWGVPECVADQVVDDLPKPFLVPVDDHRVGCLYRDRPPGVYDAGPLDGFGREAGQVRGSPVQRAPGIEAGQQQEVRYQPAHAVGLAGDLAHQPQQFLPGGRVALLHAVLGQPAHGSQRGTQLMAGISDKTPHPLLRAQRPPFTVRSRQVCGLDAGQHHIQGLGQTPDLGVPGRMVDAPGQVAARDRLRLRLDPCQRRQAGARERQADPGQQDDGNGAGERVGHLQAGYRAVEVAETVGDNQMASAGQPLYQNAPGASRCTGGRGCERRSGVAELRCGQPQRFGRAQRSARHLNLAVGADHFDQELRGQRLGTAVRIGLQLLPLDDAAGDLREVLELSV